MPQTMSVLDKVREDLAHYAMHDKTHVGIAFVARMIFLTPGFQLVLSLRIQELLFRVPFIGRLLRRIVWWLTCIVFGSEIAMAASVDGGLYVPHPYGIVVGACAVGKRVAILQHVTLGRRDHTDEGWPRIEDGVSLMAGCVVLGDITVGRNAVVGANAVVLKDVPPNSVAVGVPARIVSQLVAQEDSGDLKPGIVPYDRIGLGG